MMQLNPDTNEAVLKAMISASPDPSVLYRYPMNKDDNNWILIESGRNCRDGPSAILCRDERSMQVRNRHPQPQSHFQALAVSSRSPLA